MKIIYIICAVILILVSNYISDVIYYKIGQSHDNNKNGIDSFKLDTTRFYIVPDSFSPSQKESNNTWINGNAIKFPKILMYGNAIVVIRIDGCEYVVLLFDGESKHIIHKNNCSNHSAYLH